MPAKRGTLIAAPDPVNDGGSELETRVPDATPVPDAPPEGILDVALVGNGLFEVCIPGTVVLRLMTLVVPAAPWGTVAVTVTVASPQDPSPPLSGALAVLVALDAVEVAFREILAEVNAEERCQHLSCWNMIEEGLTC